MLSSVPQPKIAFSVDKIKSIIEILKNSRENEEVLKETYIEFYDTYPKLFKAALDKSFPMTFLDVMLMNLEKLNNNEFSVDDADKSVYGILQKEYIDPVTEKLST